MKQIRIILILAALLLFVQIAQADANDSINVTNADAIWSISQTTPLNEVTDSSGASTQVFSMVFVSNEDATWKEDIVIPSSEVTDSSGASQQVFSKVFVSNEDAAWKKDIAVPSSEVTDSSGASPQVFSIIFVSNEDAAWMVEYADTFVRSDDTSPPSSIRDLISDSGSSWINWTWTNPSDSDFNHTELYLKGTFLTNIPAPQNYYNIAGLLPDTSYELNTRTVDINGNINLTWVNDTASTLPASATTLNLYTGWNLISLPLMPEDTSIASLLSPINGNYSIIWEYNASDTFDHWKKYDPGVPFGNDLTNMEPGKGYWIMMTSDDTLPISGAVPESTDIDLRTGWNLIGFNSLNSKPIAEALSSINGNYSIVWAYNASDTTDHWKKYDPGVPFGNDLINMEPGKGYWIMMTSEGILKI